MNRNAWYRLLSRRATQLVRRWYYRAARDARDALVCQAELLATADIYDVENRRKIKAIKRELGYGFLYHNPPEWVAKREREDGEDIAVMEAEEPGSGIAWYLEMVDLNPWYAVLYRKLTQLLRRGYYAIRRKKREELDWELARTAHPEHITEEAMQRLSELHHMLGTESPYRFTRLQGQHRSVFTRRILDELKTERVQKTR